MSTADHNRLPASWLASAVSALRGGGVAVIPTDTCYGLAGDALREESVTRVLEIKGRGSRRPPAVFVPDLETAASLGSLEGRRRDLAAALLPGPRTVLIPARGETPAWLLSPEGLIGIRWTTFPVVAKILAATGLVLTATSANGTGLPPPYDLPTLAKVLPLEQVDVVISLPCGGLPPSTVIDLSSEQPRIRRAGPQSADLPFPWGSEHENRHRE